MVRFLTSFLIQIIIIHLMLLLGSSDSNAEDAYKQFSLGAGSLNATADKKAPAPGLVTAKYGFEISKEFMPYMGTGVAYSYQSDLKTGDVKNLRTGFAAQLGFNYLISKKSSLKLDYKYLSLTPDIPHGDQRSTPQSLGIGFDIKF